MIAGRLIFVLASLLVHIAAVIYGRWPELEPRRKAWTLLGSVFACVFVYFVGIAAAAGIHDHLHPATPPATSQILTHA